MFLARRAFTFLNSVRGDSGPVVGNLQYAGVKHQIFITMLELVLDFTEPFNNTWTINL